MSSSGTFAVVLWVKEGTHSVVSLSNVVEPQKQLCDYHVNDEVEVRYKSRGKTSLHPARIVEIGAKMAKTAAERQRLCREKRKSNPEAYNQYLVKERARWHRRKETGKVKTVDQMTPREIRKKRRYWREDSQKRRAAKKTEQQEHEQPTPSTSADQSHSVQPTPALLISRQKQRGRKVKRKDMASAYRQIIKMRKSEKELKRQKEKYRKRAQRAERKLKVKFCSRGQTQSASQSALDLESEETLASDDSPRKRARLFLQENEPKVERELTFHFSLLKQLRKKQEDKAISRKKVRFVNKLFGKAKCLKRHRLLSRTAKELGCSRKTLGKPCNDSASKRALSSDIQKRITDFYLKDDVSRPTAGKKETVTRKKVKKQKRFLLDSVQRLYNRFSAENSDLSISLSSFTRLKPFWVLKPRITDRDTCLCKIHENVTLKQTKLIFVGELDATDLHTVVGTIVCDSTKKSCMYRTCDACKGKAVAYKDQVDDKTKVWWWQWKNVTETVDQKKVHKVVKQKVEGDVKELKEEYAKEVEKVAKHIYNIRHQYVICSAHRDQLQDNELFIHVDFAENWCGKGGLDEIQSCHFGGSHAQLTLHNAVAYTSDRKAVSFCTISDDRYHGPAAVWAHLVPVLVHLKKMNPKVTHVHFLSDGPVTQYRGKDNIHLLANIPFDLGFQEVWWNFQEAGHGKGPPDGVGATIKRLADNIVLTGKAINDARSLVNHLRGRTSIKVFHVKDASSVRVPGGVPRVQGIMNVHQIHSTERGVVSTRDVSCSCGPSFCGCYGPVTDRNVLDAAGSGLIVPAPRLYVAASAESTASGVPDTSLQPVTGGVPDTVEPAAGGVPDTVEPAAGGVPDTVEPAAGGVPDTSASHIAEHSNLNIGTYVIIAYDDLHYVGEVLGNSPVDEYFVSVMERKGVNKFAWPQHPDRLWYDHSDICEIILPPVKTGRRGFFSIEQHVWELFFNE